MRKPVLCRAAGEGLIVPAVQTLARGQSIVHSAKVSIAFSALNSCSVITRWIWKFEWQLVALICTWKFTAIRLFYWLMILRANFAAGYRRIETCTWCVSNQWKKRVTYVICTNAPGKRSTCTPSVYYRKSIWLVTVIITYSCRLLQRYKLEVSQFSNLTHPLFVFRNWKTKFKMFDTYYRCFSTGLDYFALKVVNWGKIFSNVHWNQDSPRTGDHSWMGLISQSVWSLGLKEVLWTYTSDSFITSECDLSLRVTHNLGDSFCICDFCYIYKHFHIWQLPNGYKCE